MDRACWLVLMIFLIKCASGFGSENEKTQLVTRQEKAWEDSVTTQSWEGSLTMYPTVATWSLQTTIPSASYNAGKVVFPLSVWFSNGGFWHRRISDAAKTPSSCRGSNYECKQKNCQ